jgi:hypothetical protein
MRKCRLRPAREDEANPGVFFRHVLGRSLDDAAIKGYVNRFKSSFPTPFLNEIVDRTHDSDSAVRY